MSFSLSVKSRGQRQERGYIPAIGLLVFFDLGMMGLPIILVLLAERYIARKNVDKIKTAPIVAEIILPEVAP